MKDMNDDILIENLKRKWELKYSRYARRWWVFNPLVNEFFYFGSFGEAHDYLIREGGELT